MVPSRAISSALVLLDHDPKALTVLEARQAKTQISQAIRETHRHVGT
jgi:hypothetical protein